MGFNQHAQDPQRSVITKLVQWGNIRLIWHQILSDVGPPSGPWVPASAQKHPCRGPQLVNPGNKLASRATSVNKIAQQQRKPPECGIFFASDSTTALRT